MKNTDSIITEFKEVRENFNTPIGSRHWLIRQEQVEKDIIDWLKQKLDQAILQTKEEMIREAIKITRKSKEPIEIHGKLLDVLASLEEKEKV